MSHSSAIISGRSPKCDLRYPPATQPVCLCKEGNLNYREMTNKNRHLTTGSLRPIQDPPSCNKNQNVSKCFTCFALLAILGTESSSKYEIKNPLGQRVYFAVEENGCFDRKLCSPLRAFTIRIADNAGREVIRVIRPLRCNSCCFPCFLQELEVQSPPGTIAGYVVQNWDPFLPKFTIQNQSKEDVLKIIGPCATCGCFEDVDFEVKALNEMTTIGKISKYWSGFVNNVFTNTANFGIQVPVDLDVRIKAVMIGACFLIDLMFFENSLDGL
uniref:Phospholipid scramblase n=1 Tax=Zosterops lateralis melanops TaxID=1220523 RepID=A0A8D2P8Q4_ZOSLA